MTMSDEVSKIRINHTTSVNLNDFADENEFDLSWPDVCGFVWDGALHVLIACAAKEDRQRRFTLFLRFHADGTFQNIDTTEEQRLALDWSSIVPTPEGLVLIPDTTLPPHPAEPVHIVFLPKTDDGFGPTRQIAIEHDLPLSQTPTGDPYGRNFHQETGRILHGGIVGKDFVVAAPFRMGNFKAVAILKIDAAFQTARWQASIAGQESSMVTRLGKMFRGPKKSALACGDLLTLHGDDYPRHAGFKSEPVWPLETCTDGTALFVFSRGAKESTKYGSFGTVLAQIDMAGRSSRSIFFEDYTESSKYQARKGAFVDGGRAFIMRSEFKATDPWNGGWAHVMVPDGKTTIIRPPRGWKDMHVLDLDGRVVWFWQEDADCVKISRAAW